MRLEVQGYALPLRRPFRTAHGELRERRGFVTRVTDDAGRSGVGEAAPWPPWTEPFETCAEALRQAAARFGTAADPDAAVLGLDDEFPQLAAAPAARHALALALLDLAAQRASRPLAEHLARTALRRPAPAGHVPVNATLGATEPRAAAAEALAAVQAGFRSVKLKLAGSAEQDLAAASAVRAAIGALELRLDANAAWSRPEALARAEELAALRPAYVEQPVPAEDLEGLRAVRAAGLRVAADEAACTVARAARVLEQEAADVLVVKPMALGGPDRAMHVLSMAEQRGVPVVVTSLLDGVVARAGALHVAAMVRAPLACGLATGAWLARDVGRGPEVARGELAVPKEPGLGVALEAPFG